MNDWKVQIKSFDMDKTVKEVKCHSRRQADRADRAMNINLNHDEFYTNVVEVNDHE